MLLDIFLIIFSLFLLLFGATFLIGVFSAGPFIPSCRQWLTAFGEVVDFKRNTQFYDLGCGDGRLLRYVEKNFGVVGDGYEIAPLVYIWALIMNYIYRSKTRIHFQSLFDADLRKADVIFVYLVPFVLKKLAHKVNKECQSGTVVVSQSFRIPGLKLHKTVPRDERKKTPTFYIYHV